MVAPLRSNLWYRVSALKPKLRSHAKLHRHVYRGQLWYLLQDPSSGRVNRFTPAARLAISLMDGSRTVSEIWEICSRKLTDDAPTQDEIIHLLGQLHAADLLWSDVSPDVAESFERGEKEERARYRRSFANPMAIRLPLWDPDAFLNRFPKLIAWIWGPWGAALWLAVVLPALFLIAPHWPELSNNFSDRVLAIDNLFIVYLIFPLLKAFHELGHASATKSRGGEVHDIGLILLVLLPVPYVEASASTTFQSKYHRAMVGAAGVAVELFIASIAFYFWLLVEPGAVRAILFNIMIIAGVSTLIFNGNPLLRYDAYYVLSDLIEIPNLAARSLRWWSYLFDHYLLGNSDLEAPHASTGEKVWFICYGAASTLYRIIVTIFIALFIAGRFFFIGVLLALWAVGVMAIVPLFRGLHRIASSARKGARRSQAVAYTVVGVVLIAGFVLFVPVPYHSNADGVVWLPEDSLARANASGFVTRILVTPGAQVTKGTPLFQMSDPQSESKLSIAAATVRQWEAVYTTEVSTDFGKAQISLQKAREARSDWELARARVADLTIRASADGTFVVPQSEDLPGRYFRHGELLGYVIGNLPPLVRVVVPQDAVALVRTTTDLVEVRLADHPGLKLTGRIVRAVPSGEEYLPSRAFSKEGGGDIATDPRDTRGSKALQRMFQFDVQLDRSAPARYFGQHVYVRFQHEYEPLSVQWYRTIRLLFLSRFNV